MSKNFIFKTKIKWTEGKKGKLYSLKKPSIEVSTPPEFKGPDGYWSPEDLFLASINSCIMTTFIHFAQKESFTFLSYESEVEGEVSFEEGKLIFSSVTVRPVIEVKSESDRGKAEQLIEKSERYCLISASVKSKVTILPKIEGNF
ncbi:MAG: OsmC family protein [Candidatus Omnitrophica bacterium]|nr:OsmC family protein [Candidatus Omnitrophota bacterium]MBU1047283.1 OsmC family protein [Candidatus Omnitrophota bacterium]MBU1631165.1 OsmC family protein [Candidatus Omnitrophota bacterium]MBU1767630.1 OsmC family protein [Candidatus Omnitrophota bacterium]MBU1889132.1 OsmC family protein [Candidatus Omnitrophota bacterium]